MARNNTAEVGDEWKLGVSDEELLGRANRRLVLIIDDEPAITKTLGQVLEDESYEVIVAHNGADGVEKLVQFSPDLVFLDIWMPGLDGIQTLEQIKAILPSTEVVMISGHATISNALEATRRGAFDFIEKPLDLDTVVQIAKRATTDRSPAWSSDSYSADGENTSLESSSVLLGDSHRLNSRKNYRLLSHAGVCSQGMKGNNLGQRTLAQSAILYGQGLHSGRKSGLILEPLAPDSGVHFSLMGQNLTVPAFVDFVESTAFATTVRNGEVFASTIEHLMAALHAFRISNLLVKCNGEVPILDGSALDFCRLIDAVGIEEQVGDWYEIAVTEPVCWGDSANGGESILLEPAESLTVSYTLSYPEPIGIQQFQFCYRDPQSFVQEIAPARTFGFMRDIERLQRAGLAAGGRLDNFILIGPEGVVNTSFRFEAELARHKILDIMGDLFMLGRPLRAHVKASMTGHSDNIKVLSFLREHIIS